MGPLHRQCGGSTVVGLWIFVGHIKRRTTLWPDVGNDCTSDRDDKASIPVDGLSRGRQDGPWHDVRLGMLPKVRSNVVPAIP